MNASSLLVFPRPNTCPVRAWAVDPSQPPVIQQAQVKLDEGLALAESALIQAGHSLDEAQRLARIVAVAIIGAAGEDSVPASRLYYVLEDRIQREGWLR